MPEFKITMQETWDHGETWSDREVLDEYDPRTRRDANHFVNTLRAQYNNGLQIAYNVWKSKNPNASDTQWDQFGYDVKIGYIQS